MMDIYNTIERLKVIQSKLGKEAVGPLLGDLIADLIKLQVELSERVDRAIKEERDHETDRY